MKEYKIREVVKEKEEFILKQEIELSKSYFTEIAKIEGIDINNFMKVILPKSDNEAKEALEKGVEFEGDKFRYFATSPSLLKKDNGQALFINENVYNFKDKFEEIISLGKLTEIKNKNYLNINKDVISRIGLSLSDGQLVDISKFKVLVLSELEYKFASNYLQFASVNGLDKEIDLDNFKLERHPNKTLSHIANDGAGFATPKFFKHLRDKLELNHNLSWVTFRTVGNAGKGLLVNFDYKSYYKEVHNLDEVIVKDAWGSTKNLMNYDVILNKSQIKWLNFFSSQEEFDNLVSNSSYKNLYNTIAICKYNKNESKLHTTLNYQILSNLALNHKLLDELSKEDVRVYKSIIKDRDKDLTRLLIGDIVREEQGILSPSTKWHKLIQLDERFLTTRSCKYIINELVNKKINNLAGLDITTVAEYKTVVQDPISYFDSIALLKDEVKISKNGLAKETIYIKDEVGNKVVARCPLNSATEILKRQSVNNELLNTYLNASKDLVVYAMDNALSLQSGADADGDIICCIDNEIIYNSVIEDLDEDGNRIYFHNQFDGVKASNVLYTNENVVENIINSRGNLIGKYSNFGAILSDMNLQIPYKNKEGKFASYQKLIKVLDSNHRKAKEVLDEHIKKGTFELMSKEEYDERIVEIANKNFQDNKMWSYYLLYLQMVLIDQPKTGISISKEMKDKLKEIGLNYMKKPLYVYYSKYKKENSIVKYEDCAWTNSSLTNFSKSIIAEIGLNARKKENYKDDILFKVLNEIDAEIDENLLKKLNNLYMDYLNLRFDVEEATLLKLTNKNNIARREELRNRMNKKYDLIDIEIYEKYTEIIKNANKRVLIRTLNNVESKFNGKNKKIDSNFIIKFVFDDLVEVLIENNNIATAYKLDNENGDIQYFYNKYSKVEGVMQQESMTFIENLNRKVKNNISKKTRIRIEQHNELTSTIKVVDSIVYNKNDEIVGAMFEDNKINDGIYEVDSYDFRTKKVDTYEKAKSMTIYVKVEK